MILKSAGYSILMFTVFVFIIGLINIFTFKTYSLFKKGLVIKKKCNPTMEVEFNSGPPSKKWTRIGGSNRYQKIIKDNFETRYLINQVKREERLKNANRRVDSIQFDSSSDDEKRPKFYTECKYDVKYEVNNKNLKSTIKQRFDSIGGSMLGAYKKNSKINILVNKNKPKDIIKFEAIHNLNPYFMFVLSFILILLAVFLIYLDSKVAEIQNEF
jgi:hypothetical protein